MKTTTERRIAGLAELTAIPFTACEILAALDAVRRTVQGSGIDGACEFCRRLERARRHLRRTVRLIDESTTRLVRKVEGGR